MKRFFAAMIAFAAWGVHANPICSSCGREASADDAKVCGHCQTPFPKQEVKKANRPVAAPDKAGKKTASATNGRASGKVISIPDMPELKFSNKLATFPMPAVVFPENVDQRHSSYRGAQRLQYEIDVIQEIAPYVPDVFYEKSQLPYTERMKFLNSPEKKKIMKALQNRFESVLGETHSGESLNERFLWECDSLLILGRPLVSLWTETQSFREAVDLCGMTQLGKWMDIQKAQKRGLKYAVPEGYNEAEANHQRNYLNRFFMIYGCDEYEKTIGVAADEPIRDYLPYFSEADFAHLTPPQKKELLDLFAIMPRDPLNAPAASTGGIYTLYNQIQADKTGYRYVQKQRPNLSREKATKLQKLCLEMVIYRRPLALLRAEDYTLEQVINVCQFRYADIYLENKKNNNNTIKVGPKGLIMKNLQANALKTLGQRFNHPDWVEFGQEMYDVGQKCEVSDQKDNDAKVTP